MTEQETPTTAPAVIPPANCHNPIPGNKPFTRGDPRANRAERPKDSDRLKKLCQRIGAERSPGSEYTILEAALRRCTTSDDPRLLALFLCYGWGKPAVMESGDASAPVIQVVAVDLSKI